MSTVVEKVIYLADAYRRHGIKVTVFFCLCPIKICDILIFFTCNVADPDQNPIRMYRIHMFLALLDPDPLVRGMDLGPALDPSFT